MSIPQLTTDLNHIQALNDLPNDVTGLTSSALKAIYDQSSNEIKTYINSVLIPAMIASNLTLTPIVGLTGTEIQTIIQSAKTLIDTKSNSTDIYTKTLLDGGQLDTRYYTETELNAGQLDTRYYTETELLGGALNSLYMSLSGAYTKAQVDSMLAGIILGQITDGSLIDAKLSNSAGQIKDRININTNSILNNTRISSMGGMS